MNIQMNEFHNISICDNIGIKHFISLLQNVGAVHQSLFIKLVNSLLPHQSMFIIISEFTQNLVKSFGIQDTFCCSGLYFLALIVCQGPQNKKLVLQKVLSNPKIQFSFLIPNYTFPSKIVIVQQKVLAKVNKSIKEVKIFDFNVELTNKYYFISISINA